MVEDGELLRRIERALQILAQNKGVQREDLLKLLTGKLAILVHGWKLDLNQNIDNVRLDISKKITGCLAAIEAAVANEKIYLPERRPQGASKLSSDKRMEQFRRVVQALFNVRQEGEKSSYQEMLLMQRYGWLNSEKNREPSANYRIVHDAARDDFDFFRSEAAKILANRLRADATVRGSSSSARSGTAQLELSPGVGEHPTAESGDVTLTGENVEALDTSHGALGPTPFQAIAATPITSTRRHKRRRVALVCVFALALVGGIIATVELTGAIDGPAAGAAPPSTSSGQLPVISSTTGPVIITSAVYMRDTGTPGAWSYAFAQVLSSKDVASYGSVSHDEQQYQRWAFDKGGVTTDDDRLQIGLRGNGNGTVVIQDIQVTKHCTNPLTGTLLYVPPQGTPGDIGVYFDLDQQFPVAEDADTHASYFGALGAGHTITLARGEVATLLLDAVTSRQYCTFSLSLVIDTDAGQEVSEMVNDQGKPFQVTAAAGTGSSIPFSKYRALYIQNGAENALIPANPATFGQPFSSSTSSAGG